MARKPRSRPLQAAPTADIIQFELFKATRERVPLVQRIHNMTAAPSGRHGCKLWTGSTITSTGYPQVHTVIDGVHKGLKPARVLWEQKLGRKLSSREHICHKPHVCSQDPRCMNLDHHYLGDPKRNSDDKVASGRYCNRRLTKPQVTEIVERLDAGGDMRDLAKVYGVVPTTIRDIKQGRTWSKHTGIAFAPKPAGRPRKVAIVITAKRATHNQGAVA